MRGASSIRASFARPPERSVRHELRRRADRVLTPALGVGLATPAAPRVEARARTAHAVRRGTGRRRRRGARPAVGATRSGGALLARGTRPRRKPALAPGLRPPRRRPLRGPG